MTALGMKNSKNSTPNVSPSEKFVRRLLERSVIDVPFEFCETQDHNNSTIAHDKNHTMPRVNTYLHFPRTTEKAFHFYKSVFKTEFGPNKK